MRIHVICLCRNEVDILHGYLSHAAALFDSAHLIDHLSSDGTDAVLERFCESRQGWEFGRLLCPVYLQAEVSNALMHRAFRDGADAVMFLDPDEFLHMSDRDVLLSIVDRLQETKKVGFFLWRNCAPEGLDGRFNPFGPIWFGRESIHRKLIIPRWVWDEFGTVATMNQGNHSLLGAEAELEFVGEMLHFPIRSRDQYARKTLTSFISHTRGRSPHNLHMMALLREGRLDDATLFGQAMWYGDPAGNFEPMSSGTLEKHGYRRSGLDLAREDIGPPPVLGDALSQVLAGVLMTTHDAPEAEVIMLGSERIDLRSSQEVASMPVETFVSVPGAGKALGEFYSESFYDRQRLGSLRSARIVLGHVFSLWKPASVIDVGCGVGPWVRAAIDLGVDEALGVDGDYVQQDQLLIDAHRFRARNLESDRLELDASDRSRFDMAMSLEVAEHLPPERADSFVSILCGLSDVVLFSAAIPRQGGTNHVNEQWPGYWQERFAREGYDCFDIVRPAVWSEDSVQFWYAQNTLVYVRRDSMVHAVMSRHAVPGVPLSLVHPKKLDDAYYWGRMDVDYVRAELSHAVESSASEKAVLVEQVRRLEAQLENVYRSTSWRVTSPMRAARRLFAKRNVAS